MDAADFKLGKKLGVVDDPRTFHLRTLLDTQALPAVPREWRMARNVHQVPMFANDRYGYCTFASNGHRIVAQERSSSQRDLPLSDQDILAGYSAVTGFRPDDPSTDRGAYMLDVANYMRRTGIGREKDGTAHTISAFVKVDHSSRLEVATACNLFGGVWVGVWLPRSAQRQTGPGRVWDAPADASRLTGDFEPGSWGGHAIEVPGYDVDGGVAFTWGREQRFSWRFWDAYVDECYALISEDWFRRGGTTTRGFNLEQLQGWLAELRS